MCFDNYGSSEKYGIIMPLVWANLDTEGRSWKQIFKVLLLTPILYICDLC